MVLTTRGRETFTLSPAELMTAYDVSTLVNSPANDSMLSPYGEMPKPHLPGSWGPQGGPERATIMKQYKGHPIYGIAVPAPEHCWWSSGLIFDRDLSQTIEIKRIQGSTDVIFKVKQEAEEHGLKLCRDWIDEQIPSVI